MRTSQLQAFFVCVLQISDDEENSREGKEENKDHRIEMAKEEYQIEIVQTGLMIKTERTHEENAEGGKDQDVHEIDIDQAVVENVVIHFPPQGNNDMNMQPVIEHVGDGTVTENGLSFEGQPVIYHQLEQHVETQYQHCHRGSVPPGGAAR